MSFLLAGGPGSSPTPFTYANPSQDFNNWCRVGFYTRHQGNVGPVTVPAVLGETTGCPQLIGGEGNITLTSILCNIKNFAHSLGGGIGRRKGLKIPYRYAVCEFDPRPRHQ